MIRPVSLVTVHTHTSSSYKIIENKINNIEKRGLCQNVGRHKIRT